MNGERLRVLVVDDERGIREFLKLGLEYEGFEVQLAADGEEALRAAGAWRPHVVVLDIMMPGMDGLSVCKTLRGDPNVIIIFLSAKDEVDDRIAGLDLGADDYLVKPFSFKELLSRIRLRLRRQQPHLADVLTVGDLWMDAGAHQVRVGERRIELSPREFELLRCFMQNPNQVLSKQVLLDRVWGFDFFGDQNVVEVYVRYLREKLDDADRRLIQTVRGVGYRLGLGQESVG
ncbi:MAG TPA: response regulator transcription factor [Limnochordia bacterium]|nr:response regulator transcription factor [Limnochordia bacterium]